MHSKCLHVCICVFVCVYVYIYLILFFASSFPGYPQPQYRWLKNGVPVGDFSSSQYFRILNTQQEHAGSYKCIAKNDAGSIFSEKIDVVVACKYHDCLTSLPFSFLVIFLVIVIQTNYYTHTYKLKATEAHWILYDIQMLQ